MGEKTGVTVLWKIENFYCCSPEDDKALLSKGFYISTLSESKWYLGIYRNDEETKVFLHNVYYNDNDRLVIDYDLSFLSEDGSVLWTGDAKNVEIETDTSYEVAGYLTSEDVYGNRIENYLPKETLTVRCRIWNSRKSLTCPILYNALTRIEIKRTIFHWAIKEFSQMRVNGDKKVHVINIDYKQTRFAIELSLSDILSDEEYVNIIVELLNDSILCLISTCKISVLNTEGGIMKESRKEHNVFEPDDRIWYFSRFLTKNEWTRGMNGCLEDDELNLRFNFTVTTGEVYSNIECVTSLPPWVQTPFVYDVGVCKHLPKSPLKRDVSGPSHNSNKDERITILQKDLLSLYRDRSFSNFELRSESSSFPVHKSVLAARSPVFKAMFLSSMKEGEDNFMDIPDIDSNTLDKLLVFIYTGNVENIDWSSASKLYYAADKYDVYSLKKKCSTFLSNNISDSNVCEILLLADLHNDDTLKSSVLNFLVHNDYKIIRSKEWTQFLRSNPLLAAETMQLIYSKKLDMFSKKSA